MRLDPKRLGKLVAAKLGYDIHRRDHSHGARRAAAMRARQIDVVLDVGANRGQYVSALRDFGYPGRVVSFEPIRSAFEDLSQSRKSDPGWSGRQVAVGDKCGEVALNVSESSVLSSVLPSRTELTSRISAAAVFKVEQVELVSLDSVWTSVVHERENSMLKVDVQGFEHAVLDGCVEHMSDVLLLEIEMGLEKLYEGGSSIYDLLPRLREAGLEVISVDCGFVDVATGQVLDVDVLAGRPLTRTQIGD